jgi:nucleoside-diphosphate-sugar epimerase
MTSALIGYSGFVGSTLRKQRSFDAGFRSANIAEINGKSFDEVICAAAPAQKWKANKDPEGDLQAIQGIMAHLDTVQCGRFILISTVDVFPRPFDVNEDTPIGDHPEAYGRNRRLLERFIEERFPDHWIVRLPALVGPGLRKNIVFDFLNENNVSAIDSRGSFQFYPMVNLWADLQIAMRKELRLIHLAAEPITVAEVAQEGFGMTHNNEVVSSPAAYRFQSKHAHEFGLRGSYQYSKRDTLLAIRAYAQSEPRTLQAAG